MVVLHWKQHMAYASLSMNIYIYNLLLQKQVIEVIIGIQTEVPSVHISCKLIWSNKGQMHSLTHTTIFIYTSIASRLMLTKKLTRQFP